MASELLRCLMLLLIIPPGLLLIGPLLLVTTYRGTQRFGPLVFSVRRSGWRGRLTSGLVGVTLWVAVWGGLVWLLWPVAASFDLRYASERLSRIVMLVPRLGSHESAQRIATTPFLILTSATTLPTMIPATSTAPTLLARADMPSPVESRISVATPTFVPSMTLAPAVGANAVLTATVGLSLAEGSTMTPTKLPTATLTPTPSPTPTVTPTEPPSPTPTVTPTEPPSPTPTITPTEPPSPTPTMTPTETPTLTTTPTKIPSPTPSYTPTPSPSPSPTASPTITATPTADQARQAIAAVERANEALRLAIEMPSQERLDALRECWKDRAFTNVHAFVFSMIKLMGRPVKVSYVYLIPPLATYDRVKKVAYVDAIEIWTYEGSAITYKEKFVFHYVLAQHETGWVIVDYTYRNVPTTLSH